MREGVARHEGVRDMLEADERLERPLHAAGGRGELGTAGAHGAGAQHPAVRNERRVRAAEVEGRWPCRVGLP